MEIDKNRNKKTYKNVNIINRKFIWINLATKPRKRFQLVTFFQETELLQKNSSYTFIKI